MEFFRYTKSIYGGQDQIVGASWNLLPWFVGAAIVFIMLHTLVMAFADARARSRARRPSREAAARE